MSNIKTEKLCKKYGDFTAVRGLDLEIDSGEFFALLGVNGAGKTTTIKMLTCLSTPTSGDAFLGGYSIKEQREEVKRITNVSPQETAVAQNLTVRENLSLMAGIYGIADGNAAADDMIKKLGMDEISGKRAGKLSGGWQRRLSIAMSLITNPEILFLDEPTLGLDVIARRELWSVIEKLKGSVTIVLTTHYLEEAEALADRIGIMAHGALRAVGTAKELIDSVEAKNFEDAFIKIASEETK